jgi:hypothetical protein
VAAASGRGFDGAVSADVLVVSLATTGGWRAAASELIDGLRRAGASVAVAEVAKPRDVRTFALTDYVQARAARTAAVNAIAEHRPRAVIYCSMTAALLWPVPGAIWFDSIARENRPGRHGVWQRRAELRRLRSAPLLLPMSPRTLDPVAGAGVADAVVVPVPVAASGAVSVRDVEAVTYAGDPLKKQLGLVLEAWSRARRHGETLVVAGADVSPDADGVEVAGRMTPGDYRALLRRARLFVAAPRREDYGIAPLEALADGCMLVTTRAPGPYPALDLAAELDPRLVGEDLGAAIRAGLDDPLPGYGARAAELLAPFSRMAVDATIERDVLPRLLAA